MILYVSIYKWIGRVVISVHLPVVVIKDSVVVVSVPVSMINHPHVDYIITKHFK